MTKFRRRTPIGMGGGDTRPFLVTKNGQKSIWLIFGYYVPETLYFNKFIKIFHKNVFFGLFRAIFCDPLECLISPVWTSMIWKIFDLPIFLVKILRKFQEKSRLTALLNLKLCRKIQFPHPPTQLKT